MKTYEQLLEYPGGSACNMIDGRDKARLLSFLDVKDWGKLGFSPKEGTSPDPVKPLTEENVLSGLRGDLAFAIQKAEDQRGISSNLMHEVIRMWMWVLDDPLHEEEDYSDYGLPYYHRVAQKYNLPAQ